MKKIKISYKISLGIVVALFTIGGLVDLFMVPDVVNGMKALGYPDYLPLILGVAKLSAALCLLIPGFSKLKEWAFAGLFIDLVGALISHLVVEGFNDKVVTVRIYGMILTVTYVLFQKNQAYQKADLQ